MAKPAQRYRFFWKHIGGNTFYQVTVNVSALEYAHLGIYSHINGKLKKTVAEVVVDHMFYRIDENGVVSEHHSLNDRKHDLQVFYKNEVWPIGSAPV